MLRALALAALLASPAYAATQPFDLSTVDVIHVIEANGYKTYFLDPATRPCFTDPEAWSADVTSRGYGPAVSRGPGINAATGEKLYTFLFVDEPSRGEAWALVEGAPGIICLHAVTESTTPNT